MTGWVLTLGGSRLTISEAAALVLSRELEAQIEGSGLLDRIIAWVEDRTETPLDLSVEEAEILMVAAQRGKRRRLELPAGVVRELDVVYRWFEPPA
jgi:hypothetical protein